MSDQTNAALHDTYPDLISASDGDARTAAVIADLEALYTSPQPAALPSFDALLGLRSTAVPSVMSISSGPWKPDMRPPRLPFPGPLSSGPIVPPSGGHRDWLRQGAGIAGAVLAFVLVAVLLVAVFRPGADDGKLGAPSTDSRVREILYVANVDRDNQAIFAARSDGSGTRKIDGTTGASIESPIWSPDGTLIAFVSTTGLGSTTQSSTIVIVNARGAARARTLTTEVGSIPGITWSPDGRQLAWDTDDGSGIFVINADGTERYRLTGSAGGGSHPVWSPDSAHIAYIDNDQAALVTRDGAEELVLFEPAFNAPVSWSPDGTRIAVIKSDNSGTGSGTDIFVTSVDGTGAYQVSAGPQYDSYPAWSPDGTRITFTREDISVSTLWMMDADGGNAHAIEESPEDVEHAILVGAVQPAWSPNGQQIAFLDVRLASVGPPEVRTLIRRQGGTLVVSAPDGSDRRILVERIAAYVQPAWSPVPAPVPQPASGVLLFVARDGERGDAIYALDPDTAEARMLYTSTEFTMLSSPGPSPDGRMIVFSTYSSIVLINADGSNARAIDMSEYSGGQLSRPAWSPDSQEIAYELTRATEGEVDEVRVYNLAASESRTLVTGRGGMRPMWSPDGSQLMIHYGRSLAVINRDGIDLRTLVETTGGRTWPSWSPDGTSIAHACPSGEGFHICVLDVPSATQRQITDGAQLDSGPVWSPDGTAIAFERTDEDAQTHSIWLVRPDGSELHALIEPRTSTSEGMFAADGRPSWSLDSLRLTYLVLDGPGGRRPAGFDLGALAVVDRDGTNQRVLFDDVSYADDVAPAWMAVALDTLPQSPVVAPTVTAYPGATPRPDVTPVFVTPTTSASPEP